MKVAALGPDGTYSSEAARQYFPDSEIVFDTPITSVVDRVADGDCARGIVPIENSIQGIVTESFDSLFHRGLYVHGETVLDIHHTLAGVQQPEQPEEITRIFTHTQAAAQCRNYFQKRYPAAEIVTKDSTAEGMAIVAEGQLHDALAVGPDPAVDMYGLARVDTAIEDEAGNQTRFAAISREAQSDEEQDFVMIAVVPEVDRPGLVHGITGVMLEHSVNLTDLHSRPRRNAPLGSYMFYIRLAMSSKDEERYDSITAGIGRHGSTVRRLSAS
jgi:prephenate dehydratase